MKARLGLVVGVALLLGLAPARDLPRPDHPRPFFMGPAERARLRALAAVGGEDWSRIRHAAARGDGYWAAFLYAVEGGPANLRTARDWLVRYGARGGDIGKRALEADDAFFAAGQPWLGDVYYDVDAKPLVAYDWVYPGLQPNDRRVVEAGIRASAEFRRRALERWTQTPNLVFKPTWMVGVAGLVLDDRDLAEWGLVRSGSGGSGARLGGALSALDRMVRDGGIWAEAPLYAVQHRTLDLSLQLSRLLGLLDGQDWFRLRGPGGASVQGMIDHYLDTAYPIERTGRGPGQIRVATFGDGSTAATGDLFLVNPAGPGRHMHEELAEAWAVSGDPRYAAFLGLTTGYQTNPVDRPALVEAPLPPAPSHVWPAFGLVMLRSDESARYWTSGTAIAVAHLLTRGYGHAHRDRQSLTLYGAGRLLYVDHNAVQYETPAEGWTASTIAHNTLVVDGEDAGNAEPEAVRHEFSEPLKFFASSAREVFPGVTQTRALGLAPEYLLDLFHATSGSPRTYDYVLHSFGRPEFVSPRGPEAGADLGSRYWRLQGAHGLRTGGAWSLDFVLDALEQREREKLDAALRPAPRGRKRRLPKPPGPGAEWFDHTAAVRVTMAGEPDTLVVHGRGPQSLPMLVARRAGLTDTTFVAVHEPRVAPSPPRVASVRVLAADATSRIVEVLGDGFRDLHGVVVDPAGVSQVHRLASADGSRFAFSDHAYLRCDAAGRGVAVGDWKGLHVVGRLDGLQVAGRPAPLRHSGAAWEWGDGAVGAEASAGGNTGSPVRLVVEADNVRLEPGGSRTVALQLANRGSAPAAGRLRFEVPAGVTVRPEAVALPQLAPGRSHDVSVTVSADAASPAALRIPVRFEPASGGAPVAVAALTATVGPVLERSFRHPEPSVYRVEAPRYAAEFEMAAGRLVRLVADDETPVYEGSGLFSLWDPAGAALAGPGFTWPTTAPAYLIAKASDAARWHAAFGRDRIAFHMDRNWTQPRRTRVVLGEGWAVAGLSPRWGRRLGEAAASGSDVRSLRAAELELPGQDWSVCLQLRPAQDAHFEGSAVEFTVSSLDGDRWSVGPCRRGSLDEWVRD